MPQALKAIYHKGTFVLKTAFELPEGTEVELLIQPLQVVSPPISNIENKQQFLKSLVERMQQNPIPVNAPQFTREMLHKHTSEHTSHDFQRTTYSRNRTNS
jgi:predicted DNA-binding antitoxin AbrB/MazE fold protein